MREKISKGAISVADQASISISSLAISLSLVRGATKEEFGHFTLILAAILLAQSIQNALILSPLTSLASQPDNAARDELIGSAFRGQIWFAAVIGAVAAVALLASDLVGLTHFGAVAALATGIALSGTLLREALRATQYIRHRELEALVADLGYLSLVAISLVLLLASHGLTAANALLVTGGAATLTSLVGIARLFREIPAPTLSLRVVSIDLWAMGRWALPSVVSTWLYTNGYAYLINAFMGAAAVAEVSAARLLTVPLTMVVTAWASVARPRLSAAYKSEEAHWAAGFLKWSSAAFIVAALCYYGIVGMTYPWLEAALGAKYASISSLFAAWGCVTVFVGVRTIGMAAVLSRPAGFRQMFLYGLPAMSVGLVIAFYGASQGSAATAIMGLAGAELLLLALVWPAAIRPLRDMTARDPAR